MPTTTERMECTPSWCITRPTGRRTSAGHKARALPYLLPSSPPIMSQYEAIKTANAAYAAARKPGQLPMPPARKAAVVVRAQHCAQCTARLRVAALRAAAGERPRGSLARQRRCARTMLQHIAAGGAVVPNWARVTSASNRRVFFSPPPRFFADLHGRAHYAWQRSWSRGGVRRGGASACPLAAASSAQGFAPPVTLLLVGSTAPQDFLTSFSRTQRHARHPQRRCALHRLCERLLPSARVLAATDCLPAGGRAVEAVRSLVISQQLLGTREIYVVHHTDCGMLTFKDSDLAAVILSNLGVDVGAREFYSFSDLDQSIRDDVALLAKEPLLIKGTPIIGLRYDCTTGALHEVAKAERA